MPEPRKQHHVFRFDQMAVQVKDKVDPADANVDRYVGLEHIDPESLKIRRWGKPCDVESSKIAFKSGDIIFGKRRAYQRKLAIADFDGICSAHAMVLRPRTDVVLEGFLPFFMQSDIFMDRAVKISVGGLSPTINWKDLAKEEFALPPLEEQRRIVRVLGAVTPVEEKLYALREAAELVWLAAIERMIASQSSEQQELDALLSDIQPGKSLPGTTRAPKTGEKAVLKVSAVNPKGFLPNESKALLDQAGFVTQHSVRKGDLLITRANTADLVGATCLVQSDYPNLMLCDKTLRLVPRDGVDPKILWHALQSRSVRRQIASVATGTGAAMKNLSQSKIRRLNIALPRDASTSSKTRLLLDWCWESSSDVTCRLQAIREVRNALLARSLEEI